MNSYSKLKKIFHEAALSADIASILHWDMSTMMPKNSRDNRAEQLAYLSKIRHELISSQNVGDLIDKAKLESLDTKDKSNLREMNREYIMSSSLPSNLVEKLSSASAKCEGIWEEARKESDFNIVLPYLEELVKLSKEESLILSEQLKCSPYEALINKFEPQSKEKDIKNIFENLEIFLVPLIDQIIEKQKDESLISISNLMTSEKQKEIGIYLMKKIGFDFSRGRLDVSQHPFCGGAYQDIRITTRYNDKDPFSSLEGIMHETGHAMYELNLPQEWKYQPAGQSRGMAMHESQSLLIEMQITRSYAFKKFLSGVLNNSFNLTDSCWDIENIYKIGTRVNKSYIRVESDEVTYPLHIILRFNIEQKIFNDEIKIKDIPELWNDEYKRLFGIEVDQDKNGCLQDVHWYAGLFGYFPTYSLGALTAAQLAAQLRIEVTNLDQQIEIGDFTELLKWLKLNVHSKASLYSTDEIVQQVTNSKLNVKYFESYIKKRYL
ncbi:carboxypeptidase M32 [Alphaproteobacteria bacterium]|nr:carboxypeptidase M32 [Alphaproteobacteria bacterium]